MRNFKLLITFLFLFISLQVFSQDQNEFRLYYGASDVKIIQNEVSQRIAEYETKNFHEFGVRYLRQTGRGFSVEIGINYLSGEVIQISDGPTRMPLLSDFEKVEIVSIPIFAHYAFLKYLFVNGGPVIDFHVSENSFDSQSGLGYTVGVGGKYQIGRYSLFVNPNFKKHAGVPFHRENNHQRLTELGIQIGLGYIL